MTIRRLSKNSKLQKIGNNFVTGFSIVGEQGTVTISGDFKTHRFTSSVPASTQFSLKNYVRSNVISSTVGFSTVEYLVVGGGGGGHVAPAQGGGGGGGLLSNHFSVPVPLRGSTLDFQNANNLVGILTITVGTGGNEGGNGGSSALNTPFISLTATGGGTGGAPGGSGGGANYPGPTSAGTGSPGQGNSGGAPARNANYPSLTDNAAGGGGGAGGVGNPGIAGGPNPGIGGPGLDVSITGSPYVYSSGGGGGGGRAWVFNYGRPHDTPVPYPGGYGGSGGSGAGQGAATDPRGARNSSAATNYGAGGGGGAAAGSGTYAGSTRNGSSGAPGIVVLKYKYK